MLDFEQVTDMGVISGLHLYSVPCFSQPSGCGSSVRTTSPMPSSMWWSLQNVSLASWTCARMIRLYCSKQVSAKSEASTSQILFLSK